VQKPIGKKPKRKAEQYRLVYVDIETAFSEGDKPYIGQICIIDDAGKVLVQEYFEDPREITPEQATLILDILYSNHAVWCDPSQDLKVIKSDVRRCGKKLKTSKLRIIDVQVVEYQVLGKVPQHRTSLLKLARKYSIKPPVKFHDPFSDAVVTKGIFDAQLKQLNVDKEHLYKLDILS